MKNICGLGDAQCSMKWYYTGDEMKDRFETFRKNIHKKNRINKLKRIMNG